MLRALLLVFVGFVAAPAAANPFGPIDRKEPVAPTCPNCALRVDVFTDRITKEVLEEVQVIRKHLASLRGPRNTLNVWYVVRRGAPLSPQFREPKPVVWPPDLVLQVDEEGKVSTSLGLRELPAVVVEHRRGRATIRTSEFERFIAQTRGASR